MDKEVRTTAAAVAGISSGSTIGVGGFGICGIPNTLIRAVLDAGITDLEVVSNNCGVDDWGLGILLSGPADPTDDRLLRRREQGIRPAVSGRRTRGRADPAGNTGRAAPGRRFRHPCVYTATGVGTQIADGGLPWRYDASGGVAVASPAKETREFPVADGEQTYVLERALVCDFALVHAWKGDRHGNLIYRESAQNFNPLMAMAARFTVAEVEELVDPGELDPAQIHTPGVFVHRVLRLSEEQNEKRIEWRTVRPKAPEPVEGGAA